MERLLRIMCSLLGVDYTPTQPAKEAAREKKQDTTEKC